MLVTDVAKMGIVLIVLFVIGAWALGWLVVTVLSKGRLREQRRRETRLTAIRSLTLGEAEARVIALLREPQQFQIVESSGSPRREVSGDLPGGVRTLFERYASIRQVNSPWASLSIEAVGPAAADPTFIRVGTIAEGTDVFCEVCCRSGRESVYEVYEGEPPDPVAGVHPSVYHWLLAMASEPRA